MTVQNVPRDNSGAVVTHYLNNSTGGYEAVQGTNGTIKIQSVDSSGTASGVVTTPPSVNSLTVTTGQVELKAGASALSGRRQMVIYPPNAGTIYWGATGVLSSTGAPITSTSQPISFDFDPNTYVPLYAVSDGTNRTVQVVEVK